VGSSRVSNIIIIIIIITTILWFISFITQFLFAPIVKRDFAIIGIATIKITAHQQQQQQQQQQQHLSLVIFLFTQCRLLQALDELVFHNFLQNFICALKNTCNTYKVSIPCVMFHSF